MAYLDTVLDYDLRHHKLHESDPIFEALPPHIQNGLLEAAGSREAAVNWLKTHKIPAYGMTPLQMIQAGKMRSLSKEIIRILHNGYA